MANGVKTAAILQGLRDGGGLGAATTALIGTFNGDKSFVDYLPTGSIAITKAAQANAAAALAANPYANSFLGINPAYLLIAGFGFVLILVLK